jgi:hypothetical protein
VSLTRDTRIRCTKPEQEEKEAAVCRTQGEAGGKIPSFLDPPQGHLSILKEVQLASVSSQDMDGFGPLYLS